MERVLVSPEEVLPTEVSLSLGKIKRLEDTFRGNYEQFLTPVSLVTSTERLLLDGNHRLSLAWLFRKKIPGIIYEEGDSYLVVNPPFEPWVSVITPSFIEMLKERQQNVAHYGIHNFEDLLRNAFPSEHSLHI